MRLSLKGRMKMSIVRKQPTLLVLLGWVALTTLVALTQTAFAYQDRAKQASVTLKDNKPTQTAFTYQAQLKEGSAPANGTYAFRFALYTGQSGGRNLGELVRGRSAAGQHRRLLHRAFSTSATDSDALCDCGPSGAIECHWRSTCATRFRRLDQRRKNSTTRNQH